MARDAEAGGRPATDEVAHEVDGIGELDNPIPLWWVAVFGICTAIAVLYWVLFPAWPVPGGATPGLLGYRQRAEIDTRMAEARAGQRVWLDRIAAAEPAAILRDPELLPFALEGGRAAFADNCAPCHAPGGAGQAGVFPALVDDDWIWGGRIDAIHHTIRYGVRSGRDEARLSEMPAFKGVLTREQVVDVTEAVLALGGHPVDAARAGRGAPLYGENCAACHGERGEGNQELGAPRLSDGIWLYGGTRDAIIAQILQPRHGVMPAFEGRLADATIKMLAVYVYALGGGEPEPDATAALPR